MAAKKEEKNESLNLSDLNGTVKSAIIFPDDHFGLELAVWDNAQRIANLLPIQVQVHGDLQEEVVLKATESAKGSEMQAKYWTEYATAISRYLKASYKVKEKQAETAENVAEARLRHAELEKDLGTTLATLESSYRQVVGSYRSAIAGTQDDLSIGLTKIANQYAQSKSKKEEREQTDKQKDQTAFAKQQTSLVDRFRKAREARYVGGDVGITRRIRAAE